MKKIILLLVIILAAHQAMAKTIRVPADSATIQAGINGAVDGDTVLVADGTYTGVGNRDIDFGGKRIVLKSENGPEVTVIDCQRSGIGFYFHNGEDATAVLEGLAIYNGLGSAAAGGAVFVSSSPFLINCIFRENFGGASSQSPGLGGGAMYCFDASPTIVDCTFQMNRTLGDGAGICCDSASSPYITACIFRDNYAPDLGWYGTRGGGMHCRNASPRIVNCTFYGNAADFGAGISCEDSASPILENCIIAFLGSYWPGLGSAVHCSDGGSCPILRCCDLYANAGGDWVGCIANQRDIDGNFSADPWFCDPTSGDYRMAENSPCAPSENSCATLIGASAVGCGPKYNRTWYVKADGSGDAPTIQAAIDSCMYEDTVLVANGVYRGSGNRDIAFRGKRIVLRSEEGAQSTIIDCEGTSRGFNFLYGFEDSTALVQGFTIHHGVAYDGGGICCSYSSPKLVGCTLEDNEATSAGGGVALFHSNSVVVDCVIRNNASQRYGGGISIRSSHPRLLNCTIEKNHAPLGGAISCDGSSPILTECLLGKNSADSGGAIYAEYYSNPALINSVLYGNSAVAGAGIFFKSQSMPSMEKSIICFSSSGDAVHCWSASLNPAILCSNIFGNAGGDWVGCITDQAGINGNFSLDPLFCDTAVGYFHLAAASPCNPWNNDCHVQIGALPMGCLCDCDSLGDVNLDGAQNPVDVVLMVEFVYKGPRPPFPDLPNCPSTNGDWNCDDAINPVDVVTIVNYVYKSSGLGPCDPCQQVP